MKLKWCPQTAEISYIDTVKQFGEATESSAAEFLSAMAGGWKAKLIVEAWSSTDTIMSSIGLAIAAHHTGGRHVCIVSDERSRKEYISAMRTSPCVSSSGVSLPQVMVGDSELLLEKLVGIDFLVVDGQRKDVGKIFCLAKLSHLGGVLVCRNTTQGAFSRFRWNRVLGSNEARVVRSLALPNGLDIAYVAGVTVKSNNSPNRWISHIDQQSGEEHVYRR